METAAGHFVSQIPGRLKQVRQATDIVTVGDNVTISLNEDGTGTIESVAERRTALSRTRPAPSGRRLAADREQVLVANLDQVIFVFSIRSYIVAFESTRSFHLCNSVSKIFCSVLISNCNWVN